MYKNVLIIYFSGTGNTRLYARSIANNFKKYDLTAQETQPPAVEPAESPKEEYAFLFFKCCKLISKQGLQIIQDLKGAYPKRKLTTGVDHEKRCNDFDRSRSDRYGHRPPYRIW